MSLTSRGPTVVPPSRRRVSRRLGLALVPLVVLTVIVGVWVTGGLVTDDAKLSMVLATGWLVLAGVVSVVVGLRWRDVAVPVIAAYALSAFAVGGYLLYTSEVDRVVNEQVTSIDAAGPAAAQRVASGTFRGLAHETVGTATVVERGDGSRVLTLTEFRTDPGPDLRVYVVPGSGADVSDAVDLGRLKGNRGDQQYDLPAGVPAGSVVIWCRAFSVAFGVAELA
jgi:hypothetical protein